MAVWKVTGDAQDDVVKAMMDSRIFATKYGYTGDLSFLADEKYTSLFDRRLLEFLRHEEDSKINYDNMVFRFFKVRNEAAEENSKIDTGHFVVVFVGKEPKAISRMRSDRECFFIDDELANKSEALKTLANNDFRHAWFPCVWVKWDDFVKADLPELADYRLKVRQVRGIELFWDPRFDDFPFEKCWDALAPNLEEEDEKFLAQIVAKKDEKSEKARIEYAKKRDEFLASLR